MPAGYDEFDELMKEAEIAAWNQSHTLSSRVKQRGYYMGRKALKTSPTTVVKFAISHVPMVGPVLGFGVQKIGDKIRTKRLAGKLSRSLVADSSADRSKTLMKSLADLATKIDGNVTKQTAALATLRAALSQLNSVSSKSTAQDWTQAFWNAAYAYYRVDHYNLKLADMTDTAAEYVKNVGSYAAECTEELVKGQDELRALFVDAFDQISGDDHGLLGTRGRTSSQ